MNRARILVVDDEKVVCASCARLLSEEGYEVHTQDDPRQGLLIAEQNPYDIVLVDLKMPEINGMEFLRRIKAMRPDTEVIIMTGFAQISTAVEAIKLGAFDYVPKPLSPDQLIVVIGKAIESRELRSENRYLRRELETRYKFDNMVGWGKEMQVVYDLVTRLSATNTTALIFGESGTGKELIARAIHFNSPRKTMRFVAVDCGALHENLLESELFGHVKGAFTGAISAKKGLFEIADGGTLFLDEIANTSGRRWPANPGRYKGGTKMVRTYKRILVVDDEKIVRDSCERILIDEGYLVRAVASGREALLACRDEPIDVMLTDLRMPDMDGIEVVRAVVDEFPQIRVVMITGYPGRRSAEQAEELGIFEYLEKPLSPQRLSEVTARAMASPPRFTSPDFSLALSNPALGVPGRLREAVAEESARTEPQTRPQAASVPEAPPPAELEAVAPTAALGETDMSAVKALGLLAIAPFIGLAFVVFLPVIGYGLLFAALGKGVATKLGLMRG